MKTRIISGAVAIALLIVILVLHSTVVFNIGFALIGGLMVYELFRANKLKSILYEILSVAVVALATVLPRFCPIADSFAMYILMAFVYIVMSVAILLKDHKELSAGTVGLISGYTVMIAASMASISHIEASNADYGLANVILCFCGAWLADTGAYFVGTFFGKHKLCPEISPKKTVEGLIGGIASNALLFMLVAFIVSLIKQGTAVNYGFAAVLGVVCSVLGLYGDLLASLVKRTCGIKDFGNIMPGHGGALDRFDSMVLVAPFMALALSTFNVFTI